MVILKITCQTFANLYGVLTFISELFVAGLRTYEIIIPTQVDIEGNLLSHDVHHTVKRRWRRDVGEEVPQINYKLQVFVHTFVIHCIIPVNEVAMDL